MMLLYNRQPFRNIYKIEKDNKLGNNNCMESK